MAARKTLSRRQARCAGRPSSSDDRRELDRTGSPLVRSAPRVCSARLGDDALFEVPNFSDLSISGTVDFAQFSLMSDATVLAL
jgi:hypothetical protein